MRRIWLGLVCGALVAAAPCASAQDLNAALLQFNCGAPAPPPPVPNGRHATGEQMQEFVTRANAWQTQQQQTLRCLLAADSAMNDAVSARVSAHNQHDAQGRQAQAAWQAATGQH